MSRSDQTLAAAPRLLALATTNVRRDYPVHWTHLVASAADLVPQRVLHPVFAGSFDWHSCVHQTWLIVRLLRVRPDVAGADRAVGTLDELITPEGCAVEAEFFHGTQGAHWERPYGWAWLLLLDAELRSWRDEGGAAPARRWSTALRPVAEVLRGRLLDWLPTERFPTRTGIHINTAFSLGLVLDAARATEDAEMADCCAATALRWYRGDVAYGGYEPDAAEFLSPALVEADLMRRLLDPVAFAAWLEAFLPDLDGPRWATLREPVPVDNAGDPYGSHLAGLALSRAWCWRGVAAALPEGHRFRGPAKEAARRHAVFGREFVFGHGYAAEHWLGTFAAYLDLGALTR
ncbi:hypothetical protein GCM10012275_35680 [Longimycelium tulufanense]|uniref:DUF2891 domain-containing protein n=1 Tax=Longimycelium tulufanense TaxID=907463 RepID=A0A8J3FXE4_9PSEU|nr:DUF2891 domain-containing protein [Longimycelium tulufanense]GGM61538.1 hypothetical protein GCM10012275_35680 [Longimycelium tulufanense]